MSNHKWLEILHIYSTTEQLTLNHHTTCHFFYLMENINIMLSNRWGKHVHSSDKTRFYKHLHLFLLFCNVELFQKSSVQLWTQHMGQIQQCVIFSKPSMTKTKPCISTHLKKSNDKILQILRVGNLTKCLKFDDSLNLQNFLFDLRPFKDKNNIKHALK